ncbi:CHAT domain-containing protein (plasmid) [Tolypothrix sp. PCC 7910]|uniref:pentapeptide repeat-containing protein n=1 Tax=Tolypothrix sp. PCC 7910 TaxID=2099387 RepID=UPI0014277D27|nr:pentapeptide repeat-containing protein [Tolypothrix sp. PCC 7910]QIR41708.1 CHAT domain-containing protein [Tolypothrix sp. PCC 7910]
MLQNFSGQNLRGLSFKGQNLEGANFSYADIRGADFSGANLRGANFSNATAGLQKRWAIFLLCVSWLLAGVSGFISGYIVWLILDIVQGKNQVKLYYGFVSLIVLIVFWITTIRRNIIAGLVVGTIFTVIAINLGFAFTLDINSIIPFAAGLTGAAAGFIGVSVAVAQSIAVAGDFAVVAAGFFAFAASVAIDFLEKFPPPEKFIYSGLLLSFYIAWPAVKRNKSDVWLCSFATYFAASGGTSFRNADLTDTNFSGATLKSTDFRKANLTRTCFHKTKKLDRVHPGTTYLEKAQVRQLLVTRQGQDKNFDRQDLRGVNFQGANLVDASFIGTDLSQANLQDADLSRAKLIQTQLDGTDFTGATLTGAYIEDWGITTDTKFDGVRCEYVYMRLPTKENPDPLRKPDNHKEVFADGEFGDFIKPIFDTLDLYHNQGVDPRAIAISFKQLAENYPDAELEIVAMEKRGQDKFLLRAKTAATADKSQLSAEYFGTYNQIKSLPEREIKLLLAEKDNQIRRLENMVMTALERPSFYAQNYNNQGDTMPQGSKKESNFNLQNAQFGGGLVNADTVNAEQIGGNITNYGQQQQHKEAQTETNNSAVKTILILAANPKNTSQLRLDEEIREIDAGLQRAKKRELFDLKQRWAVRVQDVYQALLDFKPQIVHFSGHGSGDDGLALEDEAGNLKLVDTVALAKLFDLFSTTIECIVLNACYSQVQASAIAQHIPYVIGMNKAIGDKAAVKFATGFYNALGAGEGVEFAYKLGCNVIQLDGIPEHLTPVLIKKQ